MHDRRGRLQQAIEDIRRPFGKKAIYLMGYSVRKICTGLEGDGIRTARGTSEWHDSTVQGILRNEKYIGDASLQKTYAADLFNHQTKASSSTLPGTDCHRSIAETMTLVSKTA